MLFIERLEQICMEDMYNKNQIRDLVIKEIDQYMEFLLPTFKTASEALYEYFNAEYTYDSKNKRLDYVVSQEGFNIENIIKETMIITLIEDRPVKIQKIVGKLAPFFNYENIWDGIQTAAEVLAVIGKITSLFTIIPAKYSESGGIEIVSGFKLDPGTLDKIAEMQYLPPMVCKPNKIYHNYQSAYLTKNDSIILGKNNHHELPQALDVINIANSIKLSLDEKILAMEEKSKKPLDTQEKLVNFQRLVNSSKKVYAEMLEKGNEFYLSWKFDKRGRIYSLGYHVNIQSTEYKKALINLAKKEIIELE